MPAGKPNDISEKLHGLDQVPEGFRFDGAAAWRGLESRLPAGKKKRRYAFWYAAAVLVLIAIAVAFFSRQPPAPAEKKTVGTAPNLQPAIRPNLDRNVAQPFQQQQGTNLPVRNNPVARTPLPDMDQEDDPLADSNDTDQPQEEIVSHLQDTALAAAVTVAPSPKPKFKIAHINELDHAEEVPPPAPKPVNSYAMKRPAFSTLSESPLMDEERMLPKKKRSTLFLTSSSQ